MSARYRTIVRVCESGGSKRNMTGDGWLSLHGVILDSLRVPDGLSSAIVRRLKLKHNPYRYQRKLPHLQLGPPLFVSFSTHGRWILAPEARTIAFNSCMHEHERSVQMHALVVMPEHIHFLVTVRTDPKTEEPIPFYKILGAIKSASAHTINRVLNRNGKVWENEAFDRMLRKGEYESCIDYIVMNPVRRGLVDNPDDYEWLWYE